MENLPHATATFFELAIALSALSLRTLQSINHITDTAQHETEKVIKTKNLDGFWVFNLRSILGFCSWCGLILSTAGIVMFGLGEFSFWSGRSCFWTSFALFVFNALMAASSDTQKMRHFNKAEKFAAKSVERFQSGD